MTLTQRITLAQLQTAISESFAADTSAQPELWSEDNPSFGHCAVASLVVQDHFGGDLVRAVVNGVSHYWNRLPSGCECDLTLEQFGMVTSRSEPELRERDYVLGFGPTAERYRLLSERVTAGIARGA